MDHDDEQAAARTPPHSLDAERAVFGSMLIKPLVVDQLLAQLQADDFFLPQHREIFEAVLALSKRKSGIDVIAIAEELKSRGTLSRLEGGTSYLNEIANAVPTAENAQHYARLVRDKAGIRRMIASAAEIMSTGYSNPVDYDGFITDSVGKLTKVATRDDHSRSEGIGDIYDSLTADIEQIQMGRKLAFVPTGLETIDALLGGGLFPEALIVPCAQTSIGKTSFGIQVAFRNARKLQIPSLIFTLEMTKRQMLIKGVANVMQINTHVFNPPHAGERADWDQLHAAGLVVYDLQNLIRIEEHRTIGQIVAVSHAWRASLPPGCMAMILVDQIQHVVGVRTKNGNRQEEVQDVARQLKNLAKDLKLPVMAPAQLDNDAAKEKRAPRIGDIRDSKAIEHEADVIIGIHRDRMAERGRCEIILLKNRGGQVKKRVFQWVGEWQGFEPRVRTAGDDDGDED